MAGGVPDLFVAFDPEAKTGEIQIWNVAQITNRIRLDSNMVYARRVTDGRTDGQLMMMIMLMMMVMMSVRGTQYGSEGFYKQTSY